MNSSTDALGSHLPSIGDWIVWSDSLLRNSVGLPWKVTSPEEQSSTAPNTWELALTGEPPQMIAGITALSCRIAHVQHGLVFCSPEVLQVLEHLSVYGRRIDLCPQDTEFLCPSLVLSS
jgi:hypothetical protein